MAPPRVLNDSSLAFLTTARIYAKLSISGTYIEVTNKIQICTLLSTGTIMSTSLNKGHKNGCC